MNLYLFNPENDLAIAFGGENYTPPPAAQLIGKELSALPLWYADDDTTIYIPDKLPSDFLHTLAPLNLKISTVTPDRLDGAQVKQNQINWHAIGQAEITAPFPSAGGGCPLRQSRHPQHGSRIFHKTVRRNRARAA